MGPDRPRRVSRRCKTPYSRPPSTLAASMYMENHLGRRTRVPGTSPAGSWVQTPSAQFPLEFHEHPRFPKTFARDLTKKIEHYISTQTVDQLFEDRNKMFPVPSDLILINKDLKVLSADGKPLLVFLKRGLRRPFNIDPSPNGLQALEELV